MKTCRPFAFLTVYFAFLRSRIPSSFPTNNICTNISMRLCIFVIAALLANVNAVAPVQPERVTLSKTNPVDASALDRSLASVEHGNSVKRSLRTRDPVDENEDEEEEERGFFKKLKFWLWFKRGENPKTIYKMLGLEGLGQKAHEHKNFKEYLAYAKFWRAQP
ncbi:unnamed protein product [Phytophthora fragariaefolia]|uniref:RxLR effector protein n=1 Tax=Phytophthora fragariaefolia TaxID=1490495 RepID=A0A9W7D8C1_9STRA|nr:unnamed protein product [Phytophthora fragariaefolia]